MLCIYCGSDTKVINSRPQKRANRIWRRRTCMTCGTTFTSIETIDLAGSIRVRDAAKALEPFQRDKLFMSVYDSLKHRKAALTDATGLTDTVISKLLPYMKDAVLYKAAITRETIDTLKRFDKIAATHYEAFHPEKK